MPENFGNHNKSTSTRLMFGVLSFFAVLTLFLGAWKISRTINPVIIYDNPNEINASLEAGLNNIQKSTAELKSLDTDGDGLTDFDELYIYQTSPYLADSDSDGESDKKEIDEGFDPNCPKGQNCRSSGGGTTNDSRLTTDELQPPSGGSLEEGQTTGDSQLTTGTGLTDLPVELQNELGGLSASELRQLLLSSGQIDQEQLEAIDDATLMQVMREVLSQ